MSNGSAHGELVLFDCPRIRRAEYWQFIKLVAPAGRAPPCGQTHWTSQDASDAFCLKCARILRFQKGSSNSVRRHMEQFHKKELLAYAAQMQTEEAVATATSSGGKRSRGASASASSGGSTSSGRKPASTLAQRKGKRPLTAAAAAAITATTKMGLTIAQPNVEPPGSTEEEYTQSSLSVPTAKSSGSLATKRLRVNSPRRSGGDQRKGAEMLLRWLCGSMRPLSIVEDAGFAECVEYLGATSTSLTLPTRETLRHRLELMTENLRFETKQRAKKDVGHFSLSLELWRESQPAAVEAEAFVVLSCHHLNADFQTLTWPLDVLAVSETDGGAAGELLATVIRDWGLQKPHLALLLGSDDDFTRQVAAALDTRSFPDIRTVLEHALPRSMWHTQPCESSSAVSSHKASTSQAPESRREQRAISQREGGGRQEHMSRQQEGNEPSLAAPGSLVASSLAELRRTANAFNKNAGARKRLLQIHGADAHGTMEKLWTSTCESWLEVYDFLSRFVPWRASIDVFFASASSANSEISSACRLLTESASKPAASTWFVAEALLLLLQPLREVQQIVANEKACSLPFVLPCLVMVKQHLRREDLLTALLEHYHSTLGYDGVQASAELLALRTSILTHFGRSYDPLLRELLWCSALDPRYARMRHMTEDEREQCKLKLAEQAAELYASQLPSAVADPLGNLAGDFDGDMMYGVARAPVQGLMHRLLYDDEEEVGSTASGLSREAEVEQTRLYVAEEVAMYVAEHQLRKTRISCPLQWWQDNRERYPFLSPLARIWLGAVASFSFASAGAQTQTQTQIQSPWREVPPEVTRDNQRRDGDARKTTADMILLHASLLCHADVGSSL